LPARLPLAGAGVVGSVLIVDGGESGARGSPLLQTGAIKEEERWQA